MHKYTGPTIRQKKLLSEPVCTGCGIRFPDAEMMLVHQKNTGCHGRNGDASVSNLVNGFADGNVSSNGIESKSLSGLTFTDLGRKFNNLEANVNSTRRIRKKILLIKARSLDNFVNYSPSKASKYFFSTNLGIKYCLIGSSSKINSGKNIFI